MFPQLKNIFYDYNYQLEICCSLDFPKACLETNLLEELFIWDVNLGNNS